MIKGIIFDFAGVVGTEAGRLWFAEVAPQLRGKGYFSELSDEVDSARIDDKEFSKKTGELVGVKPEAVWPGIRSKLVIDYELLAFIEELRPNFKIGLLTNYVQPWIEEILTERGLRKYFDEIVISSVEKVIKPDPRIFKIMLERLKLAENEAVFIDDREKNIEGARALGIRSILFTSTDELKTELNSLLELP